MNEQTPEELVAQLAVSEATALAAVLNTLAGAAFGSTRKTWVSRGDDVVRDAHRVVAGTTVPLAGQFVVDGWPMSHPGDPSAPAHLVINCRCRLLVT